LKRKIYSKELKSKVALAAIKGNQTVNEIASEFGIHASLVNRWKKEAIEALPLVFGDSQAKQAKATEIERDRCLSSKLSPKLNLFFCSNFL
jgi:transposase